jgi:signal transduction histidine kinase
VRGLRHPHEWTRNHPLVIDGLIALTVAALGLLVDAASPPDDDYRDLDALAALLTVGSALPLVLRRRHPLAAYLAIAALCLGYLMRDYPGAGPLLALLVGLYAVAAYAGRRPALSCLVGTLVVLDTGFILDAENVTVGDVVGITGTFLAAWVLGERMRVRRAYVAAVEDRAAQLEREQEVLAQRAVLEERSRIARDLHDIVAHSVSVMVVQAGAARRTVARDPDRAVEAIGQIEATGRATLGEMRRLVGVLRDGASAGRGADAREPTSLLPQPGIDRLPELVQQCREAGLDVTLRTEGRERALPPGVELVVYRIVQEALTNTMQHAGQARAEVELTFGDHSVELSVADDGRGAASDDVLREEGPGHGLTGMQERVALYDGRFTAGPRAGGGFRVWAEIPLVEDGSADGTTGAGQSAGVDRADRVDRLDGADRSQP